MLSYQHSYHAGCLADVHKHAALCVLLDSLLQKDKPLTYFETHAGRGLYDLTSADSLKTGEAKLGIQTLLKNHLIPAGHSYAVLLQAVRERYGEYYYPGSPMVAQMKLRSKDHMHLMEMHPQEVRHLRESMAGNSAHIHHRDGYEGVLSLCPPTPGRGLVLIDPSFEVKSEYDTVARFVSKLHRKWPVGIVAIWYPVLPSGAHQEMCRQLEDMDLPKFLRQEVSFPSLSDRPGMDGSGMIVINAPYGFAEEFEKIPDLFHDRAS